MIAAPDQIAHLCGRSQRLLGTANAGRTNIFGIVYARLPAGTEWKSQVTFPAARSPAAAQAHGVAAASSVHTSSEVLYVGLRYEYAACIVTLFKENGDTVGTRRDAQAHATLQEVSAARYPGSPGAGYELMRYGRIVGPQAISPAGAPHWREVPRPDGGAGWVDLNAAGVRWFSDSDFPHWRGWHLTDDDADGDVRCNSAIVAELRGDDATATAAPSLTTQQRAGDTDKLKNLVCLFPTEWDESDAGIDQRYSWVKTLPLVSGDPERNYRKFKDFIKALGFWQAAALAGIPPRHWHLNPRAFIQALRGHGIWPDLARRWQDACTNHDLPNDAGLSEAAKTYLYEYALRSSKASSRDHADAASTAAIAALDTGNPVVFGMREQTDIDSNRGNGSWDDRVTVLKKESTGLTELAFRGSYNTEPSGRYLDGGQFKTSNNGSNVDVGGTPHFDSGRLIADRSYEYQPAYSDGYGNMIAGTNYNILKKTQASFVERLVTRTATLPRGTHVSGTNAAWITGSSANFSELRTMHFHRGYSTIASSAGCQTFPTTAGETFMDFVAKLAPLTQQTRIQYVLKGM